MEARKRVANQNDGCVFVSSTTIVMFTVTLLQRLQTPNIIAHEAQFK